MLLLRCQRVRRPWKAIVLFAPLTLLFAGCSAQDDRSSGKNGAQNSDKPVVYVVNYPLRYFAERIGGDLIDVRFPAPREVDPAFWRPDAETIAAYQDADLILLNGAGYAKWVGRVSLPLSLLIDTSKSARKQLIKTQDSVTHTHGPEGEHDHAGTAFTTWLDLQIAIIQADAIQKTLVALMPKHAERLRKNYQALETDLQAIDTQLLALSRRIGDVQLIASHPVYQYLARRYTLNFESVHWEPDVFPSADQWKTLDALHQRHGAKWLVWERPPLPRTVEELEQRGLNSIVFNPCGNTPGEGDFLSVMKQNVANLSRIAEARDGEAVQDQKRHE